MLFCLSAHVRKLSTRTRLFASFGQTATMGTGASLEAGELSAAERIVGAVLGGVVADAATTPVHWVYDPEVIKGKLQVPEPEFMEEELAMFYRAARGANTHYGDQILAALTAAHKAASNGGSTVLASDYGEALKALTGDGTEYGVFPEPEGAHDKANWPIPRKWRSHSILRFLESGSPQPDDHQADGAVKAPLIAALLSPADAAVTQKAVKEIVQTTQASDKATSSADFVAAVTRRIIGGEDLGAAARAEAEGRQQSEKTVEEPNKEEDSKEAAAPTEGEEAKAPELSFAAYTAKAISDLAAAPDNLLEFVAKTGISCALPGGVAVPVALASVYGVGADGYVSTVRKSIASGGDNASRAAIAGSLVGAAQGATSIPIEWIRKTNSAGAVLKQLKDILSPHASSKVAIAKIDHILSQLATGEDAKAAATSTEEPETADASKEEAPATSAETTGDAGTETAAPAAK